MVMVVAAFTFDHPAGVSVAPYLREAELLQAVPDAASRKRDMKTGWVWYDLAPFADAECRVSFSIAFYGGVIREVRIGISHPEFGTGWGDWSDAKEEMRVQRLTKWLKARGYDLGKYPWGEVWADRDVKTGHGNAGIRYAA